jgi:hypothetical protein
MVNWVINSEMDPLEYSKKRIKSIVQSRSATSAILLGVGMDEEIICSANLYGLISSITFII